MKKKLSLVALLLFASSFVACGGSGSSGGGGGNNPPTLQSIAVTPASQTVAPNSTQQYTATGNYSDGTMKNLTGSVTWTATAGASITSGGMATGNTPGTTSTITATSGTISGSATLTVSNPLMSIAVTPPNPTVPPGNTQQFIATGTYADSSTQNLTTSVQWQSSNSRTASISGGGLATGVAPGNVTITASMSGVSGTTSLTVSNPLQTITVTPANSSVAPGTKPQFTAMGTYFDNSSKDITASVTWASSITSVAAFGTPAQPGLATAIAQGSTTISATWSSVSGSTQLTVTNATLQSILVTPATATIPLNLQQLFTASGTFSDGTTQDVTNVAAWSSSDTTKVTITGVGTSNVIATGVGITAPNPPVTITATYKGVSSTGSVTVNAANLVSIAITPPTITTLAQGTSQQFSAIGTFTNGSTSDITRQVTWSSSDSNLATVAQKTGVVVAQSVNQPHNSVTITAALGTVSQSQTLDVTNAIVNSITVTPVSATIQPGALQLFHATAVFSFGPSQDITNDCTWNSADTSKAIVTAKGRVQGLTSTGSTPVVITATFGTVFGTANLSISGATLVSIALTPNQINLTPGATSQAIQATGTYSDNSTANLSGVVHWTSSDTTVVKVAGGIAVGQGPGLATITATDPISGVFGTASVVVTTSQLTSFTVTPPSATTYVGVQAQFTATGVAGQQTVNLTGSSSWASSNSSVATVSNTYPKQGAATGVGQGSTTVTAVFGTFSGTASLTVSSATLVSIAIVPNNPSPITPGTTATFVAKGTFSDGNTIDMTSQVTWVSSNPAVAPITSPGVANGATQGTTQITASFTQPGQSIVTSAVVTLTVQ